MTEIIPHSASYRDAAGFVFKKDHKIYRYINPSHFSDYALLFQSGLYKELTDTGRLVNHEELSREMLPDVEFGEGKIIFPEQVPFITYPYEWSFDMWKDAAIVTLKIALLAQQKGMMVKDATPFNIQFYKGRPVFIDTLSFVKYEADKPWIAYRQFCECFLGPLFLMHYCHRDIGKLFSAYPEGIPLEIVSSLLPGRALWNIDVQLHIRIQQRFTGSKKEKKENEGLFSEKKLHVLLTGLLNTVSNLKQKETGSTWDDYYTGTILGADYLAAKTVIIRNFSDKISFKSLIDLGANDGYFSLLLKDRADWIVATDGDSNCINALYKTLRKEKIKNIVPLVSVLNAPSPSLGWANAERASLTERLKADLVLVLALVHHLAISVNIPLSFIAKWLSDMAPFLIIEFVPKSDEKVKQLLMHRQDIFTGYSAESFRKEFEVYFATVCEEKVGHTDRILFLMKRR